MNLERIVITGAFGYVGTALLARLAGRRSVLGMGRRPRVAYDAPKGVDVVFADVREVGEHLGPSVGLIHLAGGGGEGACREDPVRAVRDIVRTTGAIVEAAISKGVRRMVMASTIAVYGTHRSHPAPYSETDAASPDDLYGSLKEAAEYVFTKLGDGVALRLANIYGAGSGVDMGIHGVCERFARAAASGGELTMYGDGSQPLDIVAIDDVVDAFERVLEHPGPIPSIINVGGGRTHTIRELAEAACDAGRALGKRPWVTSRPAPPGKSWPPRSLSVDLARESLGWSPQTSLATGMNGLVQMMHSSSGPNPKMSTKGQ